MSTNFAGVTFAKQKVTPSHDAIVRRAILTDGTLTGCEMSYSGSTLTMAAGQLMICGRQIVHPSAQNWAVTEQTSGFARLVISIDLTRTSTKDTFDQVLDSIQYATSKDGFAELEQTDINTSGTKYQVAACVVSLGPGGITGIVSQLEKSEGGGAGLNFKVVGGDTQPASPTENTIWVSTDVDIPFWATAASRKPPAYVAPAGTVTFWWESATSAEVSGTTDAGFMPVKYKATNPPGYMCLKPINCYQNQDGTAAGWEPMDGYIYKGGEWVQCCRAETLLYSNGDACEGVTGGWELINNGKGTLSFDENQITLNLVGRDNVNTYGGVVTKHPVDLTNMGMLTINEGWLGAQSGGDSQTYPRFGVSRTTPNSADAARDLAAYISSGTDLDVSELSGEYYVFIGAAIYGSDMFWANISVKEVKAV